MEFILQFLYLDENHCLPMATETPSELPGRASSLRKATMPAYKRYGYDVITMTTASMMRSFVVHVLI